MDISREDLHVARVVGEDDEMLVVEVAKSKDHTFELSEDKTMNRFYTVLFVRSEGGGQARVWTPWEEG